MDGGASTFVVYPRLKSEPINVQSEFNYCTAVSRIIRIISCTRGDGNTYFYVSTSLPLDSIFLVSSTVILGPDDGHATAVTPYASFYLFGGGVRARGVAVCKGSHEANTSLASHVALLQQQWYHSAVPAASPLLLPSTYLFLCELLSKRPFVTSCSAAIGRKTKREGERVRDRDSSNPAASSDVCVRVLRVS